MRERARIKPFCDELAALWESKAAGMRFGQIVVSLNKAYDKPRHDIFQLEEDEMMEVIRRFFSKEYKQKCKKDDREYRLTESWEEEIEKLDGCEPFELSTLKPLLLETWQYLIDTVDDFGIDNHAIPIIGNMYVLRNHNEYPKGVLQWEYEAYIRILDGLLSSLEEPLHPKGYDGNFYDGYIVVEECHGCEHYLNISEFDAYFDKLAKSYYEDGYSDDYDENGNEY